MVSMETKVKRPSKRSSSQIAMSNCIVNRYRAPKVSFQTQIELEFVAADLPVLSSGSWKHPLRVRFSSWCRRGGWIRRLQFQFDRKTNTNRVGLQPRPSLTRFGGAFCPKIRSTWVPAIVAHPLCRRWCNRFRPYCSCPAHPQNANRDALIFQKVLTSRLHTFQ
jgi:hypothetical protein